MQINIQSPHISPTASLTEFINNKVGKLSHFYNKIEAAEIFLKIENSDSGDNKVCEIRLAIPGSDLFAKKESDTFENAVSQVADALRGEIEKVKTKLQHH